MRNTGEKAGMEEHPCLTGNVRKSDIVVAAGRGLRTEEGFQKAVYFADLIGAQIVGTRAVLDLGWLPPEREVGLSGMRIAPRLYMSFGVSGANFHTIGMHRSEFVIAVNKDRKAPIFELADIAVLMDAQKALDHFIMNAKISFAADGRRRNYTGGDVTEVLKWIIYYAKEIERLPLE